jgi:hypothetical protein
LHKSDRWILTESKYPTFYTLTTGSKVLVRYSTDTGFWNS